MATRKCTVVRERPVKIGALSSGWATPIAPVIKRNEVAVGEFVEFTNSHAAKYVGKQI